MENKRQHPRFSFNEPVGYQRQKDFPVEGSLAEDISHQGLRLRVNQFIPLNTVLELQVQLPGRVQLVSVRAKVVWVRMSYNCVDSWEIGLQMISNDPSMIAIRNYVNLRSAEAY